MTARLIVWADSGQERCLSSSKPHLITYASFGFNYTGSEPEGRDSVIHGSQCRRFIPL
jgi:hypothetical protein